MNVATFLVNSASRFAGNSAVTYGSVSRTYAQLNQRTASLAEAMASSLGVASGDRIVLFMENRPELLEAMFATFRVGAAVVPGNSRSTSEELAFIATDCDAKVIFTDLAHADVAAEAAGARHVVVAGPQHERLIESASSADPTRVAETEPGDLAWIFYTSGTTGKPKGAMLAHSVLNFITVAWHADLQPMDEDDVTLHAAPLTHGAGFHALAAVAAGVHQIIPESVSFDPDAILDLIRDRGITNTWLVPTQIIRLTEARSRGEAVPSLRSVVYGGAPISPAALRRAIDTFGPIFVQLYGQGESPMTITVLRGRDHVDELLGSAGYCRLGVEIKVVDPDDRRLPPGAVGEVAVRGPSVMTGYWHRPEATAEAMKDGWLHTGDLGTISETGVLTLLDRAKDMIISGGSNVYAVEVEAVLASQARVSEAAVVGVVDELWGERVEAVVVAEGDHDGLQSELDALCRERLAGYKIPRCYHFVDALPRNAYGKVLKSSLRQSLGEAHEAENHQ